MRFGISMKSICLRKGDKNFGRRMMCIWWNYRLIAVFYLWRVRV